MARKYRRPPVARDRRFKKAGHADHGPPERWTHGPRALEFTEDAGVFAARALHPHVLDKLCALKLVTPAGREAGLKLHQDYVIAHVEAPVSAAWGPPKGAARDPERRFERRPAQEAAYRRWRKALAALPVETRNVVVHVACAAGWPDLHHLARMHKGLTALAKHYGIP